MNAIPLLLASLGVAACGSHNDDRDTAADSPISTATQALNEMEGMANSAIMTGLRHDLEEGRTERLALSPSLAVPLPASRGFESRLAMVQVSVVFPDGAQGACPGAMVSPNAVLTQAHCVHDQAAGRFANAVTVTTEFQGGAQPGSVNARAIHVNTAWSDRADASQDHALVVLDGDLGHQTGWFGVSTPQRDADLETTLVAVPGDAQDDEHAQMTDERLVELADWVRDGAPEGDDLSPPESTIDFDTSHRKIDQFYGFANSPGVQIAVCDFNGDGSADLALSGPDGWRSIPVAFSNGDGTFNVTNEPVVSFPLWAAEAGARLLATDFDNDGICDLALSGVSGWESIPLALSNGDGTFRVRNPMIPEFAAFASTPGARIVAGDFDNDGRGDLAAGGVAGWPTVRMAFGQPTGEFFSVSTATAVFFAARPGFNVRVGAARQVIAGDFNGDFMTDIAAVHTFPERKIFVAFSEGGGFFRTTELESAAFMSWAGIENVQIRAADMDGDGMDDLVAAGAPGWDSAIVGLSHGDGTFGFEKRALGKTFSDLMATGAEVLVGDFDGNDRADLALARRGRWFGTPVALSRAPALPTSERNDTYETASAMHLHDFSAPRRKIGHAGDQDYYRFHLGEVRQVTLRAEVSPRRGSLVMELHDAWGNPVDLSPSRITHVPGLSATDTLEGRLSAGTYYLRLRGLTGAVTGGYHLSASSAVVERREVFGVFGSDF